jgi:homeodomain-containing protein
VTKPVVSTPIARLPRFANRLNLLKSWEKTETCAISASGAYGPKNAAITRIPAPRRPRSPTIFLIAPLSYDAVALHRGPSEKLRRDRKLATSSAVATLVTPETLLRWYQRLIAQKFDGSRHRRRLGRPCVAEEVEQLATRMAEENPGWGYRRIQGALANLGHKIDKLTVRNILRRHHMDPAPQRRKGGMGWTQFLHMHWEVLAATDFFTVEVATWHGLVTY